MIGIRQFTSSAAELSGGAVAFAPPSWVILACSVHQPWSRGNELYVRADEYGFAYADRIKPTSVYYREWIGWKGSVRELVETNNPDVPSDYSYAAVSSLQPWMKMQGVQGHSVENGRGSKVVRMDLLPAGLIGLLQKHDPKALEAPQSFSA